MKKISFQILLIFLFTQGFHLPAFSLEPSRDPAWNKIIDTEQGKFTVNMQSENKKIEVKKISPANGSLAPHLRLRIFRKAQKPLEVKLSALQPEKAPLDYTGKIDQWNHESMIGVQLEFSFDKKSWKKLGARFKP